MRLLQILTYGTFTNTDIWDFYKYRLRRLLQILAYETFSNADLWDFYKLIHFQKYQVQIHLFQCFYLVSFLPFWRYKKYLVICILCKYMLNFRKVGYEGKNETLEDFEVFNIRNTVNIVAYSVMSAGKNVFLVYVFKLSIRDWKWNENSDKEAKKH